MKRSNASTSIRRLSSAFCSSVVSGLRNSPRLDLLAQPGALAVRGDVLDLVGDRAAVGLAQVRQRVGQRRARHVHAQDLGRDLGHQLGRQAERVGVERRVALGLGAERVEPRGEVAVGAVRLEQRRRGLHGLQQLLVDAVPRGAGRRAASRAAAAAAAGAGGAGARAELRAERGEDAVVEAVLALEVVLDDLQEAARLRALDDAVVVGRGHGHDLLGADHVADVAEADGVGDRAGGDDRALAGHQARDARRSCRCRRGWSAGCWRPARSSAVELVLARLGDQLVERGLEVA